MHKGAFQQRVFLNVRCKVKSRTAVKAAPSSSHLKRCVHLLPGLFHHFPHHCRTLKIAPGSFWISFFVAPLPFHLFSCRQRRRCWKTVDAGATSHFAHVLCSRNASLCNATPHIWILPLFLKAAIQPTAGYCVCDIVHIIHILLLLKQQNTTHTFAERISQWIGKKVILAVIFFLFTPIFIVRSLSIC